MTDSNSAVGMFRRLAAPCFSASTFLSIFFAISDQFLAGRTNSVDQLVEVLFDLEDSAELSERPAAEAAEIVDAGYPVRAHRICFFLRVLAAKSFDLNNEVEWVRL